MVASETITLYVSGFDTDCGVFGFDARIVGCGDGFIDGAEFCDDGNEDGGDGCSAACEFEDG
ncbi:MAG: cysteine-rich repeat protein [Bradymonadia bacterium]|jgi:cysteine-rich repeat protein